VCTNSARVGWFQTQTAQKVNITVSFLPTMNLQEKIDIVRCYFSCQESATAAIRKFKTEKGLHRDPFDSRTVKRIVDRFLETGSVADRKRSGRPSMSEARNEEVGGALEQLSASNVYGCTSTRAVSSETGIPQSSVCRIMRKNLSLYPYKLSSLIDLTHVAKTKRMEFCEWLMSSDSMPDILWSDEAYFSLNGEVNKHNCIVWAAEKPEPRVVVKSYPPKICVWMGFSGHFLHEPFFFHGSINADGYLEMLQSHMIPGLQRHRALESVIFQQDGAPPHVAKKVMEFLAGQFGDRVISRNAGRWWPPYSPDLSPVDFWFWGAVKAKVYHNFIPTTLQVLEERIRSVIAQFTPDEVSAALANLSSRMQMCLDSRGERFEHFF